MEVELPLNPREVEEYAAKADAPGFVKAIGDVNNFLRANARHWPAHICASKLGENENVRDAICQMYRKLGWTVNYVADHRDGNAYSFEPTKP